VLIAPLFVYCDRDPVDHETRLSQPRKLQQGGATSVNQRSGESRFEIYRDFARRFRWRLRREDGEVTADSARSFPSEESAREDASKARDEARLAKIETHATD
jgi:uncharacterized protein YegP (UPF0339 family)